MRRAKQWDFPKEKKNPKKSLNPTEKREMHEVFTKGIMVIAT